MDSNISDIFDNNRRRVTRRKVRLTASVSLVKRAGPIESLERPASVLGYTRDISADGLALIVPYIGMSGESLDEEGYTLRIILALPLGDVTMTALAVRYERLDETSPDIGYLIGARITEMEAKDSDLYLEYLHTL